MLSYKVKMTVKLVFNIARAGFKQRHCAGANLIRSGPPLLLVVNSGLCKKGGEGGVGWESSPS